MTITKDQRITLDILSLIDLTWGTHFTWRPLPGSTELIGIYIINGYKEVQVKTADEEFHKSRMATDKPDVAGLAEKLVDLLSQIRPCDFPTQILAKALEENDHIEITESRLTKGTWHLLLMTPTRPLPEHHAALVEQYHAAYLKKEAEEKAHAED